MSEAIFEVPADPAAALAGRPGSVRFLELAPVRAVMVDGEGAVGPEAFGPLMPGLYGTAYTLRFTLKRRGVDRKAGPLEGLYTTADGTTDLDLILGDDRGAWRWTLLMALPAEATAAELDAALAAGRAKMDPGVTDRVRIGTLDEGRVAQLLHVGPYAAERPSIERLHAAIDAAGLRPRDAHHEIYLGDPSKTAPERLRTILRHPVEPSVR
ncbi:MAG TPA: GyrI-like domain-containing protein [Candidatus Limnocylindrales bacterium]|nr:GyrI-like domain-containing protein [Candidatus Limnocylindrales bacterium]